MALPRVTPQTALPAVRQLALDLGRWTREAGPLASLPGLAAGVEQIVAAIDRPRVAVDVLVASRDRLEAVAARLAPGVSADAVVAGAEARLPSGVTLEFRVAVWPERVQRSIYEPRASLAVVDRAAGQDALVAEWAAAGAADAAAALLLQDGSPQTAFEHSGLIDVLAGGTVTERLTQAPFAALIDLLRAEGALRAVDAAAAALAAALEQERRALRAKRTLAQQAAGRLQPRSSTGGPGLAADVRSRLETSFAEFRRGVDDRADQVLSPHIGELAREVGGSLAGLTGLVQRKDGGVVRAYLPEPLAAEWASTLEQRILAHCHHDLSAMRELFARLSADIEQASSEAGVSSPTYAFRPLADDRLRRAIDGHAHQRRLFAVDVPRRSFFEYVMMARRYQMLLFMAISAFGISSIRRYQVFMLPAAILLLSVGTFNVYTTVRRERRQWQEKELEKARDQIKGETTRLLTDVRAAWTNAVNQHLTQESAAALSQIEGAARSAARRDPESESMARQVQAQMKGFDDLERKLQAASRGRDALADAIPALGADVRRLVAGGGRLP